MSLDTQLKWAHFWSVVGLLPFGLLFSLTLVAVASAGLGQPGQAPLFEPFAMLGLLVVSWLFMVAVAGPQIWWVWRLTSYDTALSSPTALALRVTGLLLVAGPFVLVQAMILLR